MNTTFTLKRENSALLIIDMQERLLPAMSDDKDKLLRNHEALVQAANAYGFPIFFSEQYPKGLGKTEPNLLRLLEGFNAYGIEKTVYNALTPELADALKRSGRKQIVITGVEAHVCVYQTARALAEQGYEVYLPFDAVSSRDAKNKKNALHLLSKQGVIIGNTELILFDWIQDAKDSHFKELQALVK